MGHKRNRGARGQRGQRGFFSVACLGSQEKNGRFSSGWFWSEQEKGLSGGRGRTVKNPTHFAGEDHPQVQLLWISNLF